MDLSSSTACGEASSDIIWEDFLIPPYDVFVSHASEDKKFVRKLVRKLDGKGLEAWYDEDELADRRSRSRRTSSGG